MNTQQSRRTFLQHSTQLAALGAAGPILSSLGLIGEAAAAAATDYKAVVCVFLYGGNDHANTLIPFDSASHSAYLRIRPGIGIARDELVPTALTAANNLGGLQFALHPSLKPLAPLFAQGKLAPLLNVGALVEPTTKSAYLSKSVRLPPKLFSHSDQQSYMQSFSPEGAGAGWGGLMGDLLQSGNGNAALTAISMAGHSLWLSGKSVSPFAAKINAVNSLLSGAGTLFSSSAAYNTMRYLITQSQQNSLIAHELGVVGERAVTLGDTVAMALAQVPETQFTTFTPGNPLSDQFKTVARLIKVGPSLGIKRQAFFVSQGGYDTHSGQLGRHADLLGTLGRAMADFYAASVQHGVQNQVTTFTLSDFGRTKGDNGDGSDHGWGGTHFIMGGAVNGGRIYGTPSIQSINASDDVISGRIIPTTSIDQLAATLALWFGVRPGDLPTILPNLSNFNSSTWNLGIV